MMKSLPFSPRLAMVCVGPVIGVVSGLVLGLFAFIAAKLRRGGGSPATTTGG